jgi:hypothetical protein
VYSEQIEEGIQQLKKCTFEIMSLTTFQLTTDPKVEDVFTNYPKSVRGKMRDLRKLVFETAEETEEIQRMEETLKWGEPSYLTKYGSTLRMDWKEKAPDQYAIYFKCTSKLVPAFREIYPETFTYEGNRAIVFSLDEKIPKKELKHCIRVAMTYHKVKHLSLLGM